MKLQRHTPKRGRIEIIPMIDTILILLIFYMSFSTFSKKEKRMDSRLPVIAKTNRTAPNNVPLDLTIHVFNHGRLTVNGAEYEITSLRDSLMQLSSISQAATLVIEGEPDTSYQSVIGVLDICAQAHLTNVAFRPFPTK